MRVHHLIVAAAASVAFAVTPALAKQVLVRGPPEIICEGISETAERSVQCGGDTAVIRFRQDEDDPNKVDEHTLRVTDGSIQLVSKVRSGYGDRDLTANVAFDSPPDRIVLDSGEAVELTAKVTCSGERIDNAGGPELSVNYAGTSVGVFGFSKTGERKLTSRGREGDVAAPDCGGEDGITHKIPFAARSNTGEFRINVGTSGGAFFSIIPLRGQIYIRYPYTLEEVPDEPEVAAGIFPDVNFARCDAANAAAREVVRRYRDAMQELAEVSELLADILDTQRYELSIESEYGKPLEAKLIWKGSYWRRLQAIDQKIGDLKTITGISIPLRILSAIEGRAKLLMRHMIQEEYEVSPSAPLREVVRKLEEIHEATQVMGDNAHKLHNHIYCQRALPEEIALEAIYHRGISNACYPENHVAGSQARAEIERAVQNYLGNSPLALTRFWPFEGSRSVATVYNLGRRTPPRPPGGRPMPSPVSGPPEPLLSVSRVSQCEASLGERVPVAEVPLHLSGEGAR